MGQKVRPISLRLGITEKWRSKWYARKADFGRFLVEDQKIRKFIKKNYFFAGIPKIEIERAGDDVRIFIHTARPGLVIGRKGSEVERLKANVDALVGRPVELHIKEVNKPELEGQLVAESVAQQLERRGAFRKALRKAAEMTMDSGAKGVKINVAGRLSGSEMARREKIIMGSIPLHTLMADISYGFTEAHTSYGQIGVKAWVYRGIVGPLSEEMEQQEESADGVDA